MQVAGDANASGHVYPDQSLYPANSVPMMVKRINQALQRADQIEHSEGNVKRDWCAHALVYRVRQCCQLQLMLSLHVYLQPCTWSHQVIPKSAHTGLPGGK